MVYFLHEICPEKLTVENQIQNSTILCSKFQQMNLYLNLFIWKIMMNNNAIKTFSTIHVSHLFLNLTMSYNLQYHFKFEGNIYIPYIKEIWIYYSYCWYQLNKSNQDSKFYIYNINIGVGKSRCIVAIQINNTVINK